MPVSASKDLKPSARSSTFKLSQVERAVTKLFSLASGAAAAGRRARRSATYRAGLLEVSGGRKSVRSTVCSQSSFRSFSTFSAVADGVASHKRVTRSSYRIGLRASARARLTTPVALTETGMPGFSGLEGARSERKSRPASTTTNGLATKLKCLLIAGSASADMTRLMSHAISGRVLVRAEVAQIPKSVFSPHAARAPPAKRPYGVGRVAIRI